MGERARIRGESPYEDEIGFSRALRVGERVLVSGTGPVLADGGCDPDPAAQARRCFELIEAAPKPLAAANMVVSMGVGPVQQGKGRSSKRRCLLVLTAFAVPVPRSSLPTR